MRALQQRLAELQSYGDEERQRMAEKHVAHIQVGRVCVGGGTSRVTVGGGDEVAKPCFADL